MEKSNIFLTLPDEAYSPTDVLEPASNVPMPNVSAEGLGKSAQDDSNGYDDANNTLTTVATTDQSLAPNIVSSTHDTTLEYYAVSSITLSMPITTDAIIFRPKWFLNLQFKLCWRHLSEWPSWPLGDMLINCNSEERKNEIKDIVDRMHRRHSSWSCWVNSVYSIYTAAFASNMDIENDSMFQSWKKFKTRGAMSCDEISKRVAQSVADKCFHGLSSSLKRRTNQESYFVISGDEVYRQKRKLRKGKCERLRKSYNRKG